MPRGVLPSGGALRSRRGTHGCGSPFGRPGGGKSAQVPTAARDIHAAPKNTHARAGGRAISRGRTFERSACVLLICASRRPPRDARTPWQRAPAARAASSAECGLPLFGGVGGVSWQSTGVWREREVATSRVNPLRRSPRRTAQTTHHAPRTINLHVRSTRVARSPCAPLGPEPDLLSETADRPRQKLLLDRHRIVWLQVEGFISGCRWRC